MIFDAKKEVVLISFKVLKKKLKKVEKNFWVNTYFLRYFVFCRKKQKCTLTWRYIQLSIKYHVRFEKVSIKCRKIDKKLF